MAFVFKEYEELLNGVLGFNKRVIPVMLEKNSVTEIVSIEEPRKSQIYFIQLIINKIVADTNMKPHRKSQILNGAMLAIIKIIDGEMGVLQQNSQLRDLLKACVGIDDTNHPSHEQASKCYRSLNSFLNFIYAEKDGVKILVPEYPDPKIDIEKLVEFVKASYAFDQEESMAAAHKLKIEEAKIEVSPIQFSPSNNLPAKLKDQVKSWAELRKAVVALINAELAKKGTGTTKSIAGPRGVQMAFLEATMQSLDNADVNQANVSSSSKGTTNAKGKNKANAPAQATETTTTARADSPPTTPMSDAHKAAIMIGALILVRGQISKEYKHSRLSSKATDSKVHTRISEILDFSHQNLDDIKTVLTLTNAYIGFLAVENRSDNGNFNPSIIRKNHLYSHIHGLDLIDFFDQFQKMIFTCRIRVLAACEPKKEQIKKSSALGHFNFFGTSKRKEKEEFDYSDEDEDKNDNSAAASSSSAAASNNK